VRLTVLGPLATVVVGFVVAYIAWRQWEVARHRLRLDLFDRRYKVYDATRKFLSVILRDAGFEDAQLWEFNAGTSDAEFLFESSVVEYLAQIRKRAVNVITQQKVYERMPVGEERSRHVQSEHDDLLWLTHQLTDMTKVFSPYLGFSQIK
jgi:hypothetical protein